MQKDLALLCLRTTLGSILLMHACDKLAMHSISVLFKDDLADHINEAVYSFSMVVQLITMNPTASLAKTVVKNGPCFV